VRGSVFHVEVPLATGTRGPLASDARGPLAADAGHGADAEPPARTASADLSGRRILVADDDLDILLGMRALLEEWGAEPLLAADAGEALEHLESGAPPDALIVDYRLGASLGTDLVEAIRERAGRRIPALVVSGSRSAELADDLARRGLPCLTKPLAPARLRAALAELLRPARGAAPNP